jgi:hypothetical protein
LTCNGIVNVIVLLPRGHFQEIERMMMLTKHGLFLTCTQKFHLYIYITHNQLFGPDPFVKMKKETPLTWKADLLLMVANPFSLWSLAW